MAALLLLPVLTLAVLAWGRKILRLLGVTPAAGLEEIILSVGLGYGALAYVTLGLGLAGGLYRGAVVAAVLVAALLSWREIPAVLRRTAAAPPEAPEWRRFAGILLIVSAVGTLLAAMAPPTAVDALAYHLGAPKLWLQAHRIHPTPWHWATFQPMNIEMLYLAAMVLWGDTLAGLVNWSLGLWTAAALFLLVRHHFPGLAPWFVTGVFYVSAMVTFESADALIELGWTFFTVLALHASLRATAGGEKPWLLLGGVFAGLAAGSKYTGIVLAGALTLAVLAGVPRDRGRVPAVLWFVLPVAVLVLPWYLRTWIWTGDPFYPLLTAWSGHDRLRASLALIYGRYGLGTGLVDLLAVPFRLILAGRRFDGGELIGPAYLSLLPLSLSAARRDRSVAALWFLVAAYGVFWFYTSQQARLLLPVLPAAAVLCGVAWSALARMPFLRQLAAGVTALWMSVATLTAVAAAAPVLPLVAGLESRDAYLTRTVPYYQDLQWMNRNLPADARVLVAGRSAYYLDRPFVGGVRTMTRDELGSWVERYGTVYIYCAERDCIQIRTWFPKASAAYRGQRRRPAGRSGEPRSSVETAVLRVERP